MKNIIYMMIILFCFSMCHNTHSKNQARHNNHQLNPILDQQIKDGLLLLIDDLNAVNDSSVFERVYTVEFFNNDDFLVFTKEDSVVMISSLSCNIEYIGYKGIVSFNDYTVAIMDEANIGSRYYDTLSLEKKPLNRLKCMNEYLRYGLTFQIRNDILKEWRPPERNVRR